MTARSLSAVISWWRNAFFRAFITLGSMQNDPPHVHPNIKDTTARLESFVAAPEHERRVALAFLLKRSTDTGTQSAITLLAALVAASALSFTVVIGLSGPITGNAALGQRTTVLVVVGAVAFVLGVAAFIVRIARRSTSTFWLDLYTRELKGPAGGQKMGAEKPEAVILPARRVANEEKPLTP